MLPRTMPLTIGRATGVTLFPLPMWISDPVRRAGHPDRRVHRMHPAERRAGRRRPDANSHRHLPFLKARIDARNSHQPVERIGGRPPRY
ncbi:hypothetical protein [Azospirillum argentinense]